MTTFAGRGAPLASTTHPSSFKPGAWKAIRRALRSCSTTTEDCADALQFGRPLRSARRHALVARVEHRGPGLAVLGDLHARGERAGLRAVVGHAREAHRVLAVELQAIALPAP